MNLSSNELKRSMIISATMPYDTFDDASALFQNCDQFLGMAVLPTFIKSLCEINSPANSCRLIGLIGYPSGGVTCSTKVSELRQLNYQGCNAFHIVSNTSLILSEEWDEVECDLYSTVNAAKGLPVTVVLEAAYLTRKNMEKVIQIIKDLEVEAISASSGWLPKVPSVDELKILKSLIGDEIVLEVAGVQNYQQLVDVSEAGASRFMVRQVHAEAFFSLMGE